MVSMYQINELVRKHNKAGVRQQQQEGMKAAAFLRSLDMTEEDLSKYQDRVEGIGHRFNEVTSRMKRPPRLFR